MTPLERATALDRSPHLVILPSHFEVLHWHVTHGWRTASSPRVWRWSDVVALLLNPLPLNLPLLLNLLLLNLQLLLNLMLLNLPLLLNLMLL